MTAAPTSVRPAKSVRPKADSTVMPGITAASRTANGKGDARRLRRTGQIPAVAYGKTLAAATIAVSPKDVLGILKTERGQNNVIKMKMGDAQDILVMIKDYSYHPVSRELEHVDFVQVKLDEEVQVELPLLFTGKPAGVTQGGIIRQVFRTVPIRCLPDRIPVKVEIDITHLNLG